METLDRCTRTLEIIDEKSNKLNRERITFVIRNKNKKQQKNVMLFGAVADLTDEKKDKDISIEVFKASHLLVKTRLLIKEISFKGLRYKTDNRKNFFNIWRIFYTNPVGGIEETSFCAANYISATQPNAEEIKEVFDPTFELAVRPDVYINFKMEPNSALALEFLFEKDPAIEKKEIERELFFNKL